MAPVAFPFLAANAIRLSQALPTLFRAVAFDLDETLVDCEHHHVVATRAMMAATGEGLDEIARKVFSDVTGKRTRDIVEAFRVATKTDHELEHLLRVRTEAFRHSVVREPPALLPGAREMLDQAAALGPVALVTSGHVGDALATLEVLGIHDRFSAIVTGEDVQRPKPDPEPYLAAAKHLGVEPRSMLVFEDSGRGVEAAKAAGCVVVAVPVARNTPPAAVRSADLVLSSMAEGLPLERLMRTLSMGRAPS